MFIMTNTWITRVVTAKKIFYTQPQNSDKQDLNKKVINTVKTILKIIILKWPNNIHMQMFYLSFYFSVLIHSSLYVCCNRLIQNVFSYTNHLQLCRQKRTVRCPWKPDENADIITEIHSEYVYWSTTSTINNN